MAPILDFCRVVRNSCSHGGSVLITGKRSRPVHWHQLTYSEADNGRVLIGGDFAMADVVILVFEASDELDKLGCPISPL
jgi:hypothetical protein